MATHFLPAATPTESAMDRLIRVMRLRWQSGERPCAEELLAQCPELPADAEEILDLLYEEFCLRQQYGLEASLEDFAARFPQWRDGLANMIVFHRLLDEGLAQPRYPEIGEAFGDYVPLAQLGAGGKGRVFLARQTSLGGRPVVLKLTPGAGREHLSLARLQHTYIVPLYASSFDPQRRLRLLCMPYFGGATLLQILVNLADKPVAARTGRDLLDALDAVPAGVPLATTGREPGRQLLAQLSYVKAVCYLGACLAEALHYAHQRGLIHLDLKPSNVLLSADGEPMLLDFHLAHEPLAAGARPTEDIGGTLLYMAPEQQQAMQAIHEGLPLPAPLGPPADVFGLGATLYELLGGEWSQTSARAPLSSCNPEVGRGLSDLLERSLSLRQEDRQNTAELAEDLRRQLHDRPLLSVPNRSWRERWKKWRLRHPTALRFLLLAAAVLCATAAAALSAWLYVEHHLDEGRLALREGREKARAQHHEEAVATFQRGLDHLGRLPFSLDLTDRLRVGLEQAERSLLEQRRQELRADLHRLAEKLRGLFGVEVVPAVRAELEAQGRALWERRQTVADELEVRGNSTALADFLDIALLWAGWQPDTQRSLQVLAEAELLLGRNLVLDAERVRIRTGTLAPNALSAQPVSAWEHRGLGRVHFRAGQLTQAHDHFQQAIALQLDDRWAHFLLGMCSYRLTRFQDAVTAFTFCLGAAAQDAVCSYNRGLAYHALKEHDKAKDDYDRAIRLAPNFASAWYNRGLLHYQKRRYPEARTDLEQVMQLDAQHEEARQLLQRLP